jgi:uncharacterized membrane protein YbaN (DUF454 family)
LGWLGIVLPLIPGLVFLALAVVIFSIFFPSIRGHMHYHSRNFPKVQEAIVKMEQWVERTIGEL